MKPTTERRPLQLEVAVAGYRKDLELLGAEVEQLRRLNADLVDRLRRQTDEANRLRAALVAKAVSA